MAAALVTFGQAVAASAISIASNAITQFWPYIIGLVVITGVIHRFKRLGKSVR